MQEAYGNIASNVIAFHYCNTEGKRGVPNNYTIARVSSCYCVGHFLGVKREIMTSSRGAYLNKTDGYTAMTNVDFMILFYRGLNG